MNTVHIEPPVREQIMENLEEIEASEGVRILFAIESGSRAWGFPSPDSDYDVRFVYARPVDWYLTINPGRDVIELPLEGEFDINGWDVRKALALLMKPNPVLLEWLASPIKYIWDEEIAQSFNSIVGDIEYTKPCLHHYLNLGHRQWKAYIEGEEQVSLKKYLYIVRPAMAIRWIRMNPDSLPPMSFYELKAGVALPEIVEKELEAIIAKKRKSKELGEGAAIAEINEFVLNEFEWAREEAPRHSIDKSARVGKADALFRKLIKSC